MTTEVLPGHEASPEQFRAVREDAALIPSAFAEVLRYLPPLPLIGRRVTADHLSFGYGIHGRAGQGLARMEAHAMIGALARQLKGLTVRNVDHRINNITRPFRSIEVISVDPA